MIPPDLAPRERVLVRNSRHTRMIAAVVEQVTATAVTLREVRSGRVREIPLDDQGAYVKRL